MGCFGRPCGLNSLVTAVFEVLQMKMKFLVSVIFSLVIVGSAFGQNLPLDVVDMSKAKGYTLGPGDEITGKVSGEKDYDFVATVDQDGMIELPFSGKPIVAKCQTERDLKTTITELLKKELRNPQLSLRVTDRKSRPPATIYGEVNSPQQVILMRKVSLVELLAFAGGVKTEAGGMVQVFRTTPPMCTSASDDSNWKSDTDDATQVPSRLFSIADVKAGKEDANPIIYPGDVVVVQKASPIYITGEVVAPQGIYLKEGGLSLSEAIAMVGGVRREAKTKNITISRLKPGTTPDSKDRETISANYDMIRKGTEKDLMLKANDIIIVDKAKESVSMMILKMAIGAGKAFVTSGATSAGYGVIY